MRLFDDRRRTEMDVARHSETTFAYLDRSGRCVMAAQRDLLETWFARYPTHHRPHLRGRLFSERESDQTSAWWELYLHEMLLRAGGNVEVSSGTPDFTVDGPTGRFHVEATARFEATAANTRSRREAALHDALDRTASGAWRLGLRLVETGSTSARGSRFRRQIEGWLRALDFDEVLRTGAVADRNGIRRYPRRVFRDQDWAIEIEAFPTGPRTDPRAVIAYGPGNVVLVENTLPLRQAINDKARVCRDLDAPLIIAVLLARDYGDEHQVENALFGEECREYTFGSNMAIVHARAIRAPGGIWSADNGDDQIAGVLAGVRLNEFSFPRIAPTFWTNPRHRRSPLDVAQASPCQHRWVDEHGRFQAGSLPTPAPFFDVDPEWPGLD